MIRQTKLFLLLALCPLVLAAQETKGRFFLEGDGELTLWTSQGKRTIHYRSPDGNYPEKEFAKIGDQLELRLIALIDYLEDHFHPDGIRIISGTRSEVRNKALRRRGALAASASLHLDGMAADLEFRGVKNEQVWEYARSLNCCGVGHYHGKSVHLDTGPSRFWDEKTSGVEKGPAPQNKLIIVRTDRDLYLPGETVSLRLARVTGYPFQVSRTISVLRNGEEVAQFPLEGKTECLPVPSRKGQRFSWTIPPDFRTTGPVTLRIRFCPNEFKEMPKSIDSNPIVIQKRE